MRFKKVEMLAMCGKFQCCRKSSLIFKNAWNPQKPVAVRSLALEKEMISQLCSENMLCCIQRWKILPGSSHSQLIPWNVWKGDSAGATHTYFDACWSALVLCACVAVPWIPAPSSPALFYNFLIQKSQMKGNKSHKWQRSTRYWLLLRWSLTIQCH